MTKEQIEKKIKYYQRRHKKLQKQLKERREVIKALGMEGREWTRNEG